MRERVAVLLLAGLAGCAAEPSAPPSFDPWPIGDAAMRPEVMFVEPSEPQPGDIVSVTYEAGWDRGILYAIDASSGEGWERRHLLISDGNGGRPTWFVAGDEVVVEAVGVTGAGPDRVPIPDTLEPGGYRICTANALQNICAPVEVIAP